MRAIILTIIGFVLISVSSAQESEDSTSKIVYEKAFDELKAMLDKTQPIDFKKAVFTVENAYMNNAMSYLSFNDEIEKLMFLCKQIHLNGDLIYNEVDKDKVSKHAAIFRLMKDSIPLNKEKTHFNLPFTYDFEDVWGSENWQSMFVTKLLVIKKGNCHSLPYLYKILAEEFGVKAWLALAPNHMYIKLQCKEYGWYNTELTSGIFPIDAWLMASGYVHLGSIQNGVYMDSLSQKESIALCLIDLAQGYEKKLGTQDGTFILKACNEVLKHSPNYINALIMKAEAKKKLFMKKLKEYEGEYPVDIFHYPDAKSLFDEMEMLYPSFPTPY